MKVLRVLDRRDYAPGLPEITREAVRAVIYDEAGRLAVVKSRAGGYYKLPGGGVNAGESNLTALSREVREETGLEIDPETAEPLGIVTERRMGRSENAIFNMHSRIYTVKLKAGFGVSRFNGREREPGWVPAFVGVREAYQTDRKLFLCRGETFLEREAYILGLLCGEITAQ